MGKDSYISISKRRFVILFEANRLSDILLTKTKLEELLQHLKIIGAFDFLCSKKGTNETNFPCGSLDRKVLDSIFPLDAIWIAVRPIVKVVRIHFLLKLASTFMERESNDLDLAIMA